MMQGEGVSPGGGEVDEFGGDDGGMGGEDGGVGGGGSGAEREPMFPPPHGNRGPMNSALSNSAMSPHGGRSRKRNKGRGLGSSLSKSASDFRGFDGGDDDHTPAQYRAVVERLENQLQAERRLVKQLRAHAVATSAQRSELEGFFVKCIGDVKRDVSRRRTKATQRSTKTRPGAAPRGSAPASPAATAGARFDKDFGEDPVAARAESPGLEDFTATDRRKVIRRLLADDYVLQMLHQMIFGPGDEPDITQGPPPNANDKFTGPGGDEGMDGGVEQHGGGGGGSFGGGGGMALDPAVEDYLYGGEQ